MSDEKAVFLAHLRPAKEGDWEEHKLDEHLREVGKLAADFAESFGSGDWAYLAGLWHDLGKYRPAFQRYIRGASGYYAHIETASGKVDHSTAGALYAISQLDGIRARILAYLIAGHHAGLADWESAEAVGTRPLSQRLNAPELLTEVLSQPIPDDIRLAKPPISKPAKGVDPALWIRLLFSCLVDADFLDTETFMDADRAAKRQGYSTLSELQERFRRHMEGLAAGAIDTPVNRIRAAILARCQQQATQPPGLFSLTVPTGGGKTLSSMAFALSHALAHSKRHIIYVVPYTSIIEQTAEVFQAIFGDAVLEHHSNLDANKETPRSRLACENWDAPVIVTTAVQFFESLFAARTSRVRKLHNIVDAVVILDEAQLLPPDFLNPILHVIDQLRTHYGVSFVFCTATQPALEPQKTSDWEFKGLQGIREIVEDQQRLHFALKRVEMSVPDDLQEGTHWHALATELQRHDTVLCIVDRRDDCRELYRLMPKGTLHLSGLMCGQHRSEVIARIKALLKQGDSVRVVSTQLIEAGVDVDFPVVYRALAGLDSIAQAAGRCNREGKLAGLGSVVVFVPPKLAPIGHLRQAQQCGRQLLQQRLANPLAPEHFKTFFRQLYWQKGVKLDLHQIQSLLKPNRELRFAFRSAANRFRIIDETRQAPVIVRYGEGSALIEQLEHREPERWLLRKLQRFIVNLPRYRHQELLNEGEIKEVHPGIFVQSFAGLYHKDLGLLGEDPAYREPEDLII
ncbi:MAG: CRISPR-associated endonuclease Cas3'' [Gammaproteobacteria bacterium]